MDNPDLDLLPPIEALARLYELRDRFGLLTAQELRATSGASIEHERAFGHRLRFGCCRDRRDSAAA